MNRADDPTRFVWKRTSPIWTGVAAASLVAMASSLFVPAFGLPEEATLVALVTLSMLVGLPGLLRTRLLGDWGIRTAWGRAGTIEVRADGVALHGRWRTRVVPYALIADVRMQGVDRVRLVLADGADVVLGCEEPDALEGTIARAWRASQHSSYRMPARVRVAVEEDAEPVLREMQEEEERVKGAIR